MITYDKNNPGNIGGYSFVTPELNNLPLIPKPTLSPLCRFPSAKISIIGVEANYLSSVY